MSSPNFLSASCDALDVTKEDAFRKFDIDPLDGKLSAAELTELQALEDELQHEHILFFRAIAQEELSIEARATLRALRAYRASKQRDLGGRLARARKKLAMGTAEYAHAKPQKPVWQTVSTFQRFPPAYNTRCMHVCMTVEPYVCMRAEG